MVVPSFLCSERVCFMWMDQPRLLTQTFALQVEVPHIARRGGSRPESRRSMFATSNPPTTKRRKEDDEDVI
jgi:hypothetical protein